VSSYVGRFAPSPTGPLHLGSAAAALASYLDARAHGGRWLLRIEDIDTPRTVAGAAQCLEEQLRYLGLEWDGPVVHQSHRLASYQRAFERLDAASRVFGCACSRREIADSLSALRRGIPEADSEPVYPGTCRQGIAGGRSPRAWRFLVNDDAVTFEDRWLGLQRQHPATDAGDFVIKRADGLWAYQLAVVVDDAQQRISQVVRGEDLADNTARQILLQRALRLPTPGYLHTPLLLGPNGEKLSKQNGAHAVPTYDPLRVLNRAARVLGLPEEGGTVAEALASWQAQWRDSYNLARD
jgi:glutamyl-Q tRNA(Asp) synthetase